MLESANLIFGGERTPLLSHDPFAPVSGLRVYCVDSAAGSRKTYTAVSMAIQRAYDYDEKYLIVMPTLELIREFKEFAERNRLGVPVIEITSRDDNNPNKKPRKFTTAALVVQHLRGCDHKDRPLKNHPEGGHLLFVTHETFVRLAPRRHRRPRQRPLSGTCIC
jgi:hypothetical protein